jgi:tetratricopeptide (TPR) repeat protein
MRARLAAAALVLLAAGPRDAAQPLLDQLQTAPTEARAAELEQRITLVWRASISPAVQLLADRAVLSLAHQDPRTAIGDLDAALDLQNDLAILWRLHAEARFANGDTRGAYADLAQALAREPRCFSALSDLSQFAEANGDYQRALEAWETLLRLEPHAPHGRGRLEALEKRAGGQQL